MSNHLRPGRENRILQKLQQVDFEDKSFIDQLMHAPVDRKSSFRYWLNQFSNQFDPADSSSPNQHDYRVIIYASAEYIAHYPAPPSAKQRLYPRMFALCEAIGEQYRIENYEAFLGELPIPVSQDLAIGIIKELHNREGVTKHELAAEYGISSKSVQTLVHQISGENKQNLLRIGGQIVRVPVSHHKERSRSESRRFYTPNSMSPIIFQLNLMQAATLLQSFHCNYEKDNLIPFDMAVDTWCQLSDYVKDRIREVFCRRDAEFDEFINSVEAAAESGTYRFMSESEMLESGNASANEQLMLAFKGRIPCDLVLTNRRSYKYQYIGYDFDRALYFAVSAENPHGNRTYFAEDEFLYLSEAF